MVEEIWVPQIDNELCTGCGECETICPVDAITMTLTTPCCPLHASFAAVLMFLASTVYAARRGIKNNRSGLVTQPWQKKETT